MLKLILIELKKIFHKKSIFVIMIIMLFFNFLNNILFYTDYDKDGNYKYLESENLDEQKVLLEEELIKYDYNKENEVSMYVNLKTKLDIIKIKEKYSSNTWQYNKINDYLYNIVEDVNIHTYQIKNNELLNKAISKLDFYEKKFESDDWKYFVNNELNTLVDEKKEIEEKIDIVKDTKEIGELKSKLAELDLKIYLLNYRLENNVKEDNNYLNKALNNYQTSFYNLNNYSNTKKLTFEENINYQNIKKTFEESKYILDNKINYNKQNNLSYQLRTIIDDYEIFIIIAILIEASSFVAEEFQTGTIKLLLIKPYSRGKILLSKYLAVIIFLIFITIYLIIVQLVIGSIFFGLSSLKIPVIIYNFNKECIVEYNIFLYMIIRIISKIPMLLMIITISFCFSTIINNIALSITMPLLIYIFTPSINYLITQYKINFLKYLINVNWNFNDYLFGEIYEIKGINFNFSIIIYLSYYILVIIFTYLNFKKKNIKNV